MKKTTVKILAIILTIVMVIPLFSGCNLDDFTSSGSYSGTNSGKVNNDKGSYEKGEGIIKIWQNSIKTNWIKVAVPIKNNGNTDLYLSSCTIDIETADGKLMQTIKYVGVYPDVIKPGETAYYYTETTYDGSETSGLKAVAHEDVKKAKVECIRYATSEIQVKDTDFLGLNVVGRVQNNSKEEASMIYIAAFFFDKSGTLIGINNSIVSDDLAPGEKIGFEAHSLMTDLKASDVASYEIYAYPNQFQF